MPWCNAAVAGLGQEREHCPADAHQASVVRHLSSGFLQGSGNGAELPEQIELIPDAPVVREPPVGAGTKHLDPGTLAPDVRRHLLAARAIADRIREAIERAELPYAEVSTEVDALVTLMELSASRAQLLYEALDESPPARVAARLRELEGSGKTELIEALEHQLTVQRKMASQLESFYDQMERIVVELDSIRGSLLSVSASTDVANQQRLAGDVRALRDELGTLADGMSEAFDERAA